jgi:hypothetical protein
VLREDLAAARGKADEALTMAREDGHGDHEDALVLVTEYLDVFDEIADEMEALCRAGQDGDDAETEQRWETVQDLDEQRKDRRSGVSDAVEDL